MNGLIIKSRSWEKIDAQKVVETCSPEHVVNLIDDAIAAIQRLQADILKWKQLLADEMERNLNNVAASELQITELQAEITRLRAGGCARDQHTTQYCGEMQSLIARLTALAEEFQTEETWDGKRNDALRYCAGRLREAIGGGDANQVGLLDIADAVIAEREEVK